MEYRVPKNYSLYFSHKDIFKDGDIIKVFVERDYDIEFHQQEFYEINISLTEIKRLLEEMLDDEYISINYSWKNEHDEYPYSLTEKGKKAWESIQE